METTQETFRSLCSRGRWRRGPQVSTLGTFGSGGIFFSFNCAAATTTTAAIPGAIGSGGDIRRHYFGADAR